MEYIKIPRAYEKLNKAKGFYAPVIMTAASGWGKSAACEYFYRRKKIFVIHCKDGQMTEMPKPGSFRSDVVVIEDMQWLNGEKAIRRLKELLHAPSIQVVMLTRGQVPNYLAEDEMDLGFVRIVESDLAFTEKEVKEYFKQMGVELHPDDVLPVTQASQGYARALYSYATRMMGGQRYSEDIQAAVWQDMYHLWDGHAYGQWIEEFVEFALSVCHFDGFTLEMAAYLTGNKDIGEVIEYSRRNMSQIEVGMDGYYFIRPEMVGYYRWKQGLLWSKEEILENYRKGASFYEMKGDFPHALEYYRKAGAIQRIKEILIWNASRHPRDGHFIEMKDYYFELPREEIANSPILIAGMSMLCSMLLLPDQSEEWYGELVAFYHDKANRKEWRRDAKVWLAYLDIGLPHRGVNGILRIMKDVFTLIQKGDMVLPEFCVTGNLPSVMNGGLDFCEWSKNDTQIAKFMGKPVEVITGKHGYGLVTLALAESGFEKGTMSTYEVMTRAGDGYEAAAHGGMLEMCFVSAGIQVRQHLVEGQLPSARRVYESFLEKARLKDAAQMFPNLEAFGVWLSLFGGVDEDIAKYIEEVPNAKVSFSTIDRYRNLIKVRCLIAENRLEEALELVFFLNGYFVSYQRNFNWIENELLKAVILYRMEDTHWEECLKEALRKACEYHFVRVVSLEGPAILPCIKEMKESGRLSDIDGEYLEKIYEECTRVALSYPDYLKFIPKETVSFTKRESQVLSLLCAGMSMDEICKTLGISYNGVKKHNRNIYKKLGVSERAEAERKAIQLGLVVHRIGGAERSEVNGAV